jgi:hypothetical protein
LERYKGLYIGKYYPPHPRGREISANVIRGKKYEKDKKKGGNLREKRRKGKEKGRTRKEKEKIGSKG